MRVYARVCVCVSQAEAACNELCLTNAVEALYFVWWLSAALDLAFACRTTYLST